MGDGGGGHWLARMEWCPAGFCVSASVNLPLHHKSRSYLLALAHPGGPGKRAVKRLWCGCLCIKYLWNCWADLHQIHSEDVLGPSLGRVWMSKSNVKVTRDKKNRKLLSHPHWQCIVQWGDSIACLLTADCVRFILGKTSFAVALNLLSAVALTCFNDWAIQMTTTTCT